MIDAPIFVGGAPRSGTTLLRVILDSHPNIACGPEFRIIPSLAALSANTRQLMGDTLSAHCGLGEEALNSVFANLISSFLESYRQARGKARIAEKTPANALHFSELARLFPSAFFVSIIRDGRDVVSSLMKMDWFEARTGERMAITTHAECAARAWVSHIEEARKVAAVGGRFFEIRYEDLVESPESELRKLFDFLGEPWRPEVLSFEKNETIFVGMNESSAQSVARGLNHSARGRWRRDLSTADKTAVKSVAGDLLIKLGYAHDQNW
ncbi:MAG: hypothetical protein GC153_04065 [Alphaproteobacteria bacterium]|nr:hypothetical protein [Alphaproteobacteria bacterium]